MRDRIKLYHGNGGEGTQELIKEILKYLDNQFLRELSDSAILELKGKIAFTTDSYTVSPPFFRGGDIGKLSVYGTVNDLSVVGATPIFLSLSFIIEEGFSFSDFKRVLASIKEASIRCGVKVVTGDTKVVEKGKGDKIFINTSGLGIIEEGRDISKRVIREGDLVLVNGGIGEHGISIMLERLGVDVGDDVASDLSPLNSLILSLIDYSKGVKFIRDATRGGVATILNEVSKKYGVDIEIWEDRIPIKSWVRRSSELLGIDPLYLANEGKIVIIVEREEGDRILDFLKKHPLGRDSAIIGEIKKGNGKVYMKTKLGTEILVQTLKREILPRIC